MESRAQKIPIDIYYLSKDSNETLPYFFIKWSNHDKRYRVSTSFKHLNKTYGLRINIIRNLYIDLEKSEKIILDDGLIYYKYLDQKNKTEIFLIKREFDEGQGTEINYLMVFFSLNFWSVEDYLTHLKHPNIKLSKEQTCLNQ